MKREIIAKINHLYGQETVQDIRFAIGEISAMPRAVEKNTEKKAWDFDARRLTEDDRKEISSILDAVGDEELRDILKRVITRERIRKKITTDSEGH